MAMAEVGEWKLTIGSNSVLSAACPHAAVHDPRRVRAPGLQARTRDLPRRVRAPGLQASVQAGNGARAFLAWRFNPFCE